MTETPHKSVECEAVRARTSRAEAARLSRSSRSGAAGGYVALALRSYLQGASCLIRTDCLRADVTKEQVWRVPTAVGIAVPMSENDSLPRGCSSEEAHERATEHGRSSKTKARTSRMRAKRRDRPTLRSTGNDSVVHTGDTEQRPLGHQNGGRTRGSGQKVGRESTTREGRRRRERRDENRGIAASSGGRRQGRVQHGQTGLGLGDTDRVS